MMDKQFQIYSVDTNSFYNPEEEKINKRKKWLSITLGLIEEYILYSLIKQLDDIPAKDKKYEFKNVCDLYYQKRQNKYVKRDINRLKKTYKTILKSGEFKGILKENELYQKHKEKIKELNSELNEKRTTNIKLRQLNPKKVSKYNIVAMFDSYLSRTLGFDQNQLTTDIIIVRVYHYEMLQQLLENGFEFNKEKYRFFTSSAGQIRTKKVIFIKDSVWNQFKNSLMCGLGIDEINKSEYKGCNINKFLAYLALCNSATSEWEDFDIDKAIVIPDFESEVTGLVDFIDNKTFKATRTEMNIPITHSDGCGWVLPDKNNQNKNFMVRLPWVKGLMTPVDYLAFCKEHNNGNYKVKDIYGKEWDLLKDNIRYVFSKSQFKMWKYYSNWQQYKDNYKEYNCHASVCNIEPNTNDFKNANFNYQMWQTLTDIEEAEIKYFTDPIDNYITKAYTDRDTMLNIMGATKGNKKKSYLQQALEIYPELLSDPYVKDRLSQTINKVKKEAKYAKFKIEARNTFILPDVFGWLQYSLGKIENPSGLLANGQVSCQLYKEKSKLIVNRSPHLYKEHAVRANILSDKTEKWFITNGVYTSCHDLISKTLQFDVDGDKAVVVADDMLISIAEKNMKGIVPLYYEMGVAEAQEINSTNIYSSLTNAFKYSNIGKYSNALTSLWNSDNPDIEVIKAITALNNYSIDAAKTLEMPETEGEMAYKINGAFNLKLPYFFQFAKDKDRDKVMDMNDSTVNRICQQIESIKQSKFYFGKNRFRYAKLMNNSKITINPIVINEYKRLNKEMQKYFFRNDSMEKEEIAVAVWDIIQYEFIMFCKKNNVEYIDAVDMVLKHVYTKNRYSKKKFLFKVFGIVIVQNLKNNVDEGTMLCSKCGKRVEKTGKNMKMCLECSTENKREKARLRKQKSRQKKAS